MATARFNIATINNSSAGLAIIPEENTIVVYSGSNFKTPDTNGVFQNISVPVNLTQEQCAFGSLTNTVTSSAIFTFTSSSNLLKLHNSATQEGISFSLTTIKKVNVTTNSFPTVLNVEGSAGIISGSGGGVTVTAGSAGFDDSLGKFGGYITLQAGSGSATQNTFTQVAGLGGGIALYGGIGGNSSGSPKGGGGGSVNAVAGNGGNSQNGFGGDGANVFLTAGTAGSGSLGSGNGGNIEITSGQSFTQGFFGDSGYIRIDIASRSLGDTLSNASIRFDTQRYAKNILFGWNHLLANQNSDCYFIVSGSSTKKSLFIGDIVTSASLIAHQGLSGSLTKLVDGTSYLIAGNNTSIISQSNGSVTIASTDTEFHTTGSILTTNNTATLLQSYTLSNNSVYTLEYKVIAGKTDLTETAQFIREVHSFNLSGSATIQRISTRISDYKSDPTWDLNVTTNGAAIEVWVTGTLTDNIRWKSNLNGFLLQM